jgi:hypothetical protein
MRKAREWLRCAMRGGRLAEVAAVSDPLDAGTIRRTRRLVRRGEVAEDPPSARLAVALAREEQRRFSPGGLVFVVLLAAAALGFAGSRLEDGRVSVIVILSAGFGSWACWTCWQSWRLDATARHAELANMRLLADAGEPYPRRPPSGLLPASASTQAAGAIIRWVFYDLSYGAFTLALEGEAIWLGRIVLRGALWATFMIVFNVVYQRRERERQSEKPTVGQRGTWA